MNASIKMPLVALAAVSMVFMISSSVIQSAAAVPAPAIISARQDGTLIDSDTPGSLVGGNIECLGIVGNASATVMQCFLIPPNVTPTIPNAVAAESVATTDCDGPGPNTAMCGTTDFDIALFTEPGDWHFLVVFRNSTGQIVDLAGIDFRIHSFFVVPESPIGVAALMGSSLAALGGYMVFKRRSHKGSAGMTGTGLGI